MVGAAFPINDSKSGASVATVEIEWLFLPTGM